MKYEILKNTKQSESDLQPIQHEDFEDIKVIILCINRALPPRGIGLASQQDVRRYNFELKKKPVTYRFRCQWCFNESDLTFELDPKSKSYKTYFKPSTTITDKFYHDFKIA